MQKGRKSKPKRQFMRDDKVIVTDKKGRVCVILGVLVEDKNVLRSGEPSTFNKLGVA